VIVAALTATSGRGRYCSALAAKRLSRSFFVALLVCLVGLTSVPGFAQTVEADATLSRDYVKDVLNESVNTNTLFASQDVISNGRFVQRRLNQPDSKYEMFRIPGEVVFGDDSDTVRPFVRGGVGLLRTTAGVAPRGPEGQNDFSITELFALTSGSGAWIQLSDELSIAPAMLVSYTHLSNSYDFNNSFSQQVLAREFGDFYNWRLDLLTYTPSLRVVYQRNLGAGTLRNTVAASQLINDSIRSTSDAAQINSASGIVSTRLEYRRDLGISVHDNRLAAQPFFQWSNISGKAASGLNLVNLYEVGADLISVLKDPWFIFSEIYVGASYVTGDNFEGYHIGIGGHV
jgi:hypothetical protein